MQVTISQPFAAFIQKAKTKAGNNLVISNIDYYQNQLNKFKPGEKVTVTISNKRARRTEQQNRYYWGVYLPLIAQEKGDLNIDRLHACFTGLFLTEGVYDVLGHKVRIKKSTTQLSVAEFCQYIMAIEAETGVMAPPTENYGLESLQEGINQ